jgi:hypothetical protein
MLCPYCHVEYTQERPCFCQPRQTSDEEKAERELRAKSGESIAWNAQRGVRLD